MAHAKSSVTRKPAKRNEEGYGEIADDRPLVPDDVYQLRYVHYRTASLFKVPKVIVTFKIITMGPHFETHIERFYRVNKLKGKVGKFGDFVASRSGDLVHELTRLMQPTKRFDRISFVALKNVIVLGRTRTVGKDYDNNPLPESLRYSVLAELIEIEDAHHKIVPISLKQCSADPTNADPPRVP